MKKTALIILIGSAVLTVLFLGIWLAGFVVAETFGGLIHIFLLLAVVTGLGVFAGALLLIIAMVQKK